MVKLARCAADVGMASKLTQEFPPPRVRRPPVAYSSCRRRVAKLERYKFLVSHHTRLAPYVLKIPPLEELVPEIKEPIDRMTLLPREISRLTPVVYWILQEAGVPTKIDVSERDWQPGPKETTVTRTYDLVTDFLDHAHDQRFFELLQRVLEEGIGAYESRMEVARSERYNPVVWLARIIRMPITIMEYAGIIPDNLLIARLFSLALQLLMFLILLFAAVRMGAGIPWEALVRAILKMKG
jgi:hypothetical protein